MKKFASQNDLDEKKISFEEIGKDLFAFTAEGDPNSGIIVGDDSVMVIDAQATPTLARQVIQKVRSVTDKPISHLVLSHYHAVRVLGAAEYKAGNIIMSSKARAMVVERGQEDWDSEFDRFPRLFNGHEEIPGLTWPTTTFDKKMSLFLGKRQVDLYFLGRAHTAGDIVIHVPDSNVLFTGDIVEYKSACYCGDAHLQDWPQTLEKIAKFRAARKIWAKIMKERFKAKNDKSLICRFHTQTAGSTLAAQEIDNNIVRTTLQASAAILGGTQSLHTNSRDEALALPSEDSALKF